MIDLLTQHISKGLPSKTNDNKSTWPPNIWTAFSQRTYLFEAIKARAAEMGFAWVSRDEKLREAARLLDRERNSRGLTLTQFLVYLKKTDGAVRSRRKREIGEDGIETGRMVRARTAYENC